MYTEEELRRLKEQDERFLLLAEAYIKTLPVDKQEEMRKAVNAVHEDVEKYIAEESK